MQVGLCGRSFSVIALVIVLATAWSCSEVTDAPAELSEKRLRDRIELVWPNFVNGNFDAYVAMWSPRMRQSFQESEQDWQRSLENLKLFLSREKPTFELLDVQITGLRARAKMRVSTLEEDGSRGYDIVYDYWVFENGDWFLDDAGRTE